MLHQIKPALAARRADKIRATREQLRHRMIEAAHRRAVDEQAVGCHGLLLSRHSGAMQSIEPGISRFRVWSFGPSRNDGVGLLRRFRLRSLSYGGQASQ